MGYLLVVGGDAVHVVTGVFCILDIQARLPRNFMSLDSSQQLCAFAREHGSDDHLNATAERGLHLLSEGDLVVQGNGRVVKSIFKRSTTQTSLNGANRLYLS